MYGAESYLVLIVALCRECPFVSFAGDIGEASYETSSYDLLTANSLDLVSVSRSVLCF